MKRYYAVAEGKNPGIYESLKEAREQVKGFSRPKWKGCNELADAHKFMRAHASLPYSFYRLINCRNESKHNPVKICYICERPFREMTDICRGCNKLSSTIGAGQKKFAWLADSELLKDVFCLELQEIHDYVLSNRCGLKKSIPTGDEWTECRRQVDVKRLVARQKNTQLLEVDTLINAPSFIRQLFGHKRFLSINFVKLLGTSENPVITIHCLRCNREHTFRYIDYMESKVTHECIGRLSSGSAVVRTFLEESEIKYLSEFETLKCLNPRTGRQLPFDFELLKYKIIIEVHGGQHFQQINFFHDETGDFEYQLWKDAYKKSFAESNGYVYLAIKYEDFCGDKYKKMILAAIVNVQR